MPVRNGRHFAPDALHAGIGRLTESDTEGNQRVAAGKDRAAAPQVGQPAQGLQRLKSDHDIRLAVIHAGRAPAAEQQGGLHHAAALGHAVHFAANGFKTGVQSRPCQQIGGRQRALAAHADKIDAQPRFACFRFHWLSAGKNKVMVYFLIDDAPVLCG